MNTKQKKALYESIMKSVSKTVKKQINEHNDVEDPEEMSLNSFVEDTDDETLFYIMSIRSYSKLKNVLNQRCLQYDIENTDKVIVVPYDVEPQFYDTLNRKLLEFGDHHMFKISIIGSDYDDIIYNILDYISYM